MLYSLGILSAEIYETRTKRTPNCSVQPLDFAGFTRCTSPLSVLRPYVSCRFPSSTASAKADRTGAPPLSAPT